MLSFLDPPNPYVVALLAAVTTVVTLLVVIAVGDLRQKLTLNLRGHASWLQRLEGAQEEQRCKFDAQLTALTEEVGSHHAAVSGLTLLVETRTEVVRSKAEALTKELAEHVARATERHRDVGERFMAVEAVAGGTTKALTQLQSDLLTLREDALALVNKTLFKAEQVAATAEANSHRSEEALRKLAGRLEALTTDCNALTTETRRQLAAQLARLAAGLDSAAAAVRNEGVMVRPIVQEDAA